ncbi:MAG: S-layer homology domain-containing protein [Chloroflexota bacterium]|nr:S-layer homology domain-containing protein [Chloroflexota bacterium]
MNRSNRANHKRIRITTALALSGLLFAGMTFATPATPGFAAPQGTTFVVNTIEDSTDGACTPLGDNGADCTLREAITLSNSTTGADAIHFSIGSGVASIALTSALPNLTDRVTIDGTTQPGYAGKPLIELNGQNAGPITAGLKITGGNNVTIKGLAINRFGGQGIYIVSSTGSNVISGNFIGTDVTGNVDLGNGTEGITIMHSPNNTIGGTTPQARNLISGNDRNGMYIHGTSSTNNLIQGNYIGTNISGTVALGNVQSGMIIDGAPLNTVGGPGGARNIVSANGFLGIALSNSVVTPDSNNNKVQNNYVGTGVDGVTVLGEQSIGIYVQGSPYNTIGGGVGLGNVIAGHDRAGIMLSHEGSVGNTVLTNAILDGSAGIDIGQDGMTPNDVLDADGGINNGQNFPTLASAGTTSVSGSLDSERNKTYTIEFFANDACAPSGFGPGQTFLGSTVVTTGANGSASFTFNYPNTLPGGKFITATATNNTTNDTSEFSACRQIPPSPTATATATSTATNTATNTATSTNTSVPTNTTTSTNTSLPTNTATATSTAISTNTSVPTSTATNVPANTATNTIVPTHTATTIPSATATTTSNTCNPQFSDMPSDHPFYQYARCLVCNGVVSGYADGTFRPNAQVTRGQLSKMVANAAGYDEDVTGQTFSDVDPNSPFYPYIERLAKRGIIGGYSDGTFQPNNSVTRGQLAKIVSGAVGEPGSTGQQLFEDVQPGSPFYQWVQHLAGQGMMSGYPCGADGEPCGVGNKPYFRPGNHATRGQTTKIVTGAFFPECVGSPGSAR